ncbi:hypothetical protein JY651_24855 [Pyxidicoccus parkwayensis]|uniref:Uncharacterized protein n=1 Tax=Pyxidicoccus parkwayensis TaxID=2813578 RepID=A0ABX7NIA1_9BACT|nr:hypothetical protein [Pyxidicoccus parkwaysis]QSQ18602.1 hypothetical protein JY651_24855 [Pyxidicoccus parkwaysis]
MKKMKVAVRRKGAAVSSTQGDADGRRWPSLEKLALTVALSGAVYFLASVSCSGRGVTEVDGRSAWEFSVSGKAEARGTVASEPRGLRGSAGQ